MLLHSHHPVKWSNPWPSNKRTEKQLPPKMQYMSTAPWTVVQISIDFFPQMITVYPLAQAEELPQREVSIEANCVVLNPFSTNYFKFTQDTTCPSPFFKYVSELWENTQLLSPCTLNLNIPVGKKRAVI